MYHATCLTLPFSYRCFYIHHTVNIHGPPDKIQIIPQALINIFGHPMNAPGLHILPRSGCVLMEHLHLDNFVPDVDIPFQPDSTQWNHWNLHSHCFQSTIMSDDVRNSLVIGRAGVNISATPDMGRNLASVANHSK